MNKIKCTSCGWEGDAEDMLSAQSPFKPEIIYACPRCKEIEQVVGVDTEHPSLHEVNLHNCINATAARICCHPMLHGKIDGQTSKDIVKMITLCAEMAWKLAKEQ